MGFFSNIFGTPQEANPNQQEVPWIALNKISQLDEIDSESALNSVVIFKHSTRCGISRSVLRRFEQDFDFSEEMPKFYFLDLLAHRDVSEAVAQRYLAEHESPQMLVIQKGKLVYNVSHHDIQVYGLKQVI
jgi:bacillithiol system protein YtxJ